MINKKNIFTGIIISFSFFSFYLLYKNSNSVKLSDLKIAIEQKPSNSFISEELIREKVGSFFPSDSILNTKVNVFQNITKAEEISSQIDEVEKAEFFVDTQGNVNCNILVREPVVRVINNYSQYYLDKNARVMPLSDYFTAKAYIVTGKITQNDYKDIIKTFKYIKNHKFLAHYIVGARKKENSFTFFTSTDYHNIEFGDLKEIEKKFQRLLLFYKTIITKSNMGLYSNIDLSFKNQIIGKKNKL